MVKSALNHIATHFLLTHAAAPLPGPASALATNAALACITSGRHCAITVLAGADIGRFPGNLLPILLHYDHLRRPGASTDGGASPLGNLSSLRQFTGSGAGLSCVLRF